MKIQRYLQLRLIISALFYLWVMGVVIFLIQDAWLFSVRFDRLRQQSQSVRRYVAHHNSDVVQLARWWSARPPMVDGGVLSTRLLSLLDPHLVIKIRSEVAVSQPSGAPSYCRYYQLAYSASFPGVMALVRVLALLPNNIYMHKIAIVNADSGLMLKLTAGVCHVS